MAMNIVNVLEDSSTGKLNQNQKGTAGKAHVSPLPGPGTQSRNRMMVTLGTTRQEANWPAGSNITYLTFVAVSNAATPAQTAEVDAYVIVTIDAGNDAEADANLGTSGAPPSALTTDSQVLVIPLNTPVAVPLDVALSSGALGGGRVDARCSSDVAGDKIDLWIGAN